MTTTWWPARRRLAALAVSAGTLTAAVVALDGGHVHLAAAYVAIVVAAVLFPAVITLQVLVGQVLVGSLLMSTDGPASLLLLPVVAGVVATAEFLAVVARLDTPLERDPGEPLRDAGIASFLGTGVFGAVVWVGGLPGPTGLVAVGLAAGGCVALAALLLGKVRQSQGGGVFTGTAGLGEVGTGDTGTIDDQLGRRLF